ncbi:hypothetical protein GCG54_00005544 [Colletotrichum gloeosporioides]|uniref:Uncharacterized protein n=1 Tax=Colletotrichum gloeosporioides TaxID=474922 RepID=A0A8H4CCB3_COLGL|nr:uncharacterized protein GCG54_00005544 [Colletotrichum gloeosporioides]KAF3801388.1 hypothetical protein GCG54_00005544 [Colletotrichum gloeosporioides]
MPVKTPLTFGDLPAELRLMIWDLAASVRTSRPGLHFIPSYIGNTPYPVTIKDVDVSSIAGNGSEYLLDAGLWTACRDSREAMKKKWKEVKRKYVHNVGPIRRDLTPSRIGLICEGDKTYGFSVNPLEDLLCLQIPQDATYNDFTSRIKLPFWNDYWYGQRGYRSIAFEFDNSWAFDPSSKPIAELRQTPGPRACFLNLLMDMTARSEDDGRGEAFETLSLVDRSVLRRPDCRKYWGERVFHAQNRKFGRVYDQSDVARGFPTSSMNALEFLNILKEEIPHLWFKIRCDIAVFARNSKLKSKPRPKHRPKRVKTGKVRVERI